jgi:hypothetical protein
MNCSFCGNNGHTVNFCNDLTIHMVYERIHQHFLLACQSDDEFTMEVFNKFKANMYRQFTFKELNSVCVKYVSVTLNVIKHLITRLFLHFSEIKKQNLISLQKYNIPKYNIKPIFTLVDNTQSQELVQECPICYVNLQPTQVINLNCNHAFCETCINETFKLKKTPTCACCRETISTFTFHTLDTFKLLSPHCI